MHIEAGVEATSAMPDVGCSKILEQVIKLELAKMGVSTENFISSLQMHPTQLLDTLTKERMSIAEGEWQCYFLHSNKYGHHRKWTNAQWLKELIAQLSCYADMQQCRYYMIRNELAKEDITIEKIAAGLQPHVVAILKKETLMAVDMATRFKPDADCAAQAQVECCYTLIAGGPTTVESVPTLKKKPAGKGGHSQKKKKQAIRRQNATQKSLGAQSESDLLARARQLLHMVQLTMVTTHFLKDIAAEGGFVGTTAKIWDAHVANQTRAKSASYSNWKALSGNPLIKTSSAFDHLEIGRAFRLLLVYDGIQDNERLEFYGAPGSKYEHLEQQARCEKAAENNNFYALRWKQRCSDLQGFLLVNEKKTDGGDGFAGAVQAD